jgi:hypothetical protein
MADCVAALRGVAVRSRCFNVAARLRNAPGVLVYNPLGRSSRVLLAKVEFSSTGDRRSASPVCVAANSEPMQRPAEAEADGDADKQSVGNPVRFASSLVSAAASVASGESEKADKKRNRRGERTVYLLAAIASSIGFTTLAAGAVYYRFYWQMQVRISLHTITQISGEITRLLVYSVCVQCPSLFVSDES